MNKQQHFASLERHQLSHVVGGGDATESSPPLSRTATTALSTASVTAALTGSSPSDAKIYSNAR